MFIGFILYNNLTAKYLPFFLKSLGEQKVDNFKIVAFDNSDEIENDNTIFIKKYYPKIEIVRSKKNIGFSRAYNILVDRAIKAGKNFFLAVNPDIIFEPNAIYQMTDALIKQSQLGSVSPKILKWDFVNKRKTKIIDSCGIKILPGLRFVDIGQGKIDIGQYDKADILGPSGAAAMYRLSALDKIKDSSGYFDENMFMYKEDCDLAYRLFLAGYKSKLIPEAIVYHDRTSSSIENGIFSIIINRKNKNKEVNRWSFLNQEIIFWKFWPTINFINKLNLVWYQVKMLSFIIFFETSLLKELKNLYYIRKKLKIYKV